MPPENVSLFINKFLADHRLLKYKERFLNIKGYKNVKDVLSLTSEEIKKVSSRNKVVRNLEKGLKKEREKTFIISNFRSIYHLALKTQETEATDDQIKTLAKEIAVYVDHLISRKLNFNGLSNIIIGSCCSMYPCIEKLDGKGGVSLLVTKVQQSLSNLKKAAKKKDLKKKKSRQPKTTSESNKNQNGTNVNKKQDTNRSNLNRTSSTSKDSVISLEDDSSSSEDDSSSESDVSLDERRKKRKISSNQLEMIRSKRNNASSKQAK